MTVRKKAAAEYVFDQIAVDIKRLGATVGGRSTLGAALDHLALDRRGPNGHAYDTTPGGRAEAWCWTHQRPVTACHDDQDNQAICAGEPITIDDPTGEAALTADQASAHRATIAAHLTRIRRVLDRLMPLVENHTTATGDLGRLGQDNADPGCGSCSRVKAPSGNGRYWSPAHRTTNVGGNLPGSMPLCQTCIRDVTELGRLPSKKDVETRRDGGRVRRKAG